MPRKRLKQRGTLGGPDDRHYARLSLQPLVVIEAWLPAWPKRAAYHIGEALAMIARCGTKGQAVRDLRKAAFMLARAADVLEAWQERRKRKRKKGRK